MANILSISSSVCTSYVGNSATNFVYQRLGHEVWPINTIALPHHPGHGVIADTAQLITPPDVLSAALEALEAHNWLSGADAVVVGYMANAEQSQRVADWLHRLRRIAPDIIVMVDPIMGDCGALYVDRSVAEAARDLLLPLADIGKPNAFELGWMTGKTIDSQTTALKVAQSLGLPETVVTSTPSHDSSVANLVLTADEAFVTQTRQLGPVPKGTGDLFGALYLSARLNDLAPAQALEQATARIFGVLSAATDEDRRELSLVQGQDHLSTLEVPYPARSVAVPSSEIAPSADAAATQTS